MSEKHKKAYLEYVKIHRYGKYTDKLIGPFKSGLNIVYGPNESGKSTTASCIGGVLYGWDRHIQQKNSYRPQEGRRSASLFYREGKYRFEFKRTRNADGIQDLSPIPYCTLHPEYASVEDFLVGDIDKKTFVSLFSLTSDELLRLENTHDITSTLLTAGSGTEVSPVAALREINDRINDLCSRKASVPQSFKNLNKKLSECQDQLRTLRIEAESLRSQHIELRKITDEIQHTQDTRRLSQATIDELMHVSTELGAQKKALQNYQTQLADVEHMLDELDIEEQVALRHADSVLMISANEEASCREELNGFTTKHNQLEAILHNAQEAFDQAAAHYQVLTTTQIVKPGVPAQPSYKKIAIFGVVLAVAFLLVSVISLGMGTSSGKSLYFIEAGLGVVSALVVGIALLVFGFKISTPNHPVTPMLQTAQFGVKEKQELLVRAKVNMEAHNTEVKEYLDRSVVSVCAGSVVRAYELLDQARKSRETLTDIKQRYETFHVEHDQLMRKIKAVQAENETLIREHNLDDIMSIESLHQRILEAEKQREQALDRLERLHVRQGEIEQALRSGVESHELDKLKIQREELTTQKNESLDELITLFLARDILESSITSWQDTSQPEVYAEASRLLRIMTNNAWQSVYMDNHGQLRVVDAVLTQQPVYHLSLGTCQQLYLALRIALLMHADTVGRALCVLADDILVNFDEERQRSALLALQELSKKRQVIVFTCHQEVKQLAIDCGCRETLNVIGL